MKRTTSIIGLLYSTTFLLAQSHYDYMDDSAVAGGADRDIVVGTGAWVFTKIISHDNYSESIHQYSRSNYQYFRTNSFFFRNKLRVHRRVPTVKFYPDTIGALV